MSNFTEKGEGNHDRCSLADVWVRDRAADRFVDSRYHEEGGAMIRYTGTVRGFRRALAASRELEAQGYTLSDPKVRWTWAQHTLEGLREQVLREGARA